MEIKHGCKNCQNISTLSQHCMTDMTEIAWMSSIWSTWLDRVSWSEGMSASLNQTLDTAFLGSATIRNFIFMPSIFSSDSILKQALKWKQEWLDSGSSSQPACPGSMLCSKESSRCVVTEMMGRDLSNNTVLALYAPITRSGTRDQITMLDLATQQ